MFLSLPRLGANLSTLIVQCVSAVAAAAIEFGWLGAALTPLQILCAALTLAGVSVGLLPRSLTRASPERFAAGVGWALLSALGQGSGAVLSRKAFAVASTVHQQVDPGTAAYLRVIGGLAFGGAVLAVMLVAGRVRLAGDRRAWPWVLGNALTGPVLGVTCFQWALRTTPAGLVQPIVAIAPLLTIPFAVWIEGAAKPRLSYYAGSLLAVIGATGIVLAR
jgi:drug/metabolite transporter (DMT)-like permease